MVDLVGVLSHLKPFKVLVAGDFMLDRYTKGAVGRISPEAPVPVLHVQSQHSLPGGAGNVALNLASLGAEVSVLGRIGPDQDGNLLKDLLHEYSINTNHLVIEEGFHTPIKNRLLGGGQQMLRIDFEKTHPIPDDLVALSLENLPDVDLIAISDYNKGFLTNALLQGLIAYGKKREIPIIVDPKGDDFTKYASATLIKPNLKEAYSASKCSSDAPLETVAKTLLKQSKAEQILITRSSDGLSLFSKDGAQTHFPVQAKEVQDVTGAGDTVLSILAMALANNLSSSVAARLSNIAAGIAIEKLGCALLTLGEIAERLLELDSSNKVFDERHLYALEQTLKGKDFTVLGIDSEDGMTTELFTTLKSLASQDEKLIVYIRNNHPDQNFVSLLASLHEVDFIVIKSESLAHLCDVIHPKCAYRFENNKLEPLESVAAIISS